MYLYIFWLLTMRSLLIGWCFMNSPCHSFLLSAINMYIFLHFKMFINLQRLLSITALLILVSTKLNCLTVGVQFLHLSSGQGETSNFTTEELNCNLSRSIGETLELWVKQRTYQCLNSLSLVHLMWKSTFNLGLIVSKFVSLFLIIVFVIWPYLSSFEWTFY